jgi:hypothetical protein
MSWGSFAYGAAIGIAGLLLCAVLLIVAGELPRAIDQIAHERAEGVPLRFSCLRAWVWYLCVRPGFRLGRVYEPDPDEALVESVASVELNVPCPACHAAVAQCCRRLPLRRPSCDCLDCTCGTSLPFGVYHTARRAAIMLRGSCL